VTRLYLIRHGQAYCNVPPFGTVAGPKGDEGLTPIGVRQAERLRDRLAATGEIGADVLIASTLPRAMRTAEIIAPVLGVPIIPDDDVQEMRVGELDGLPWEQAQELWADHHVDPYQPLGPGGENWPQFQLRVATALHRIITEHAGKSIVVVCHGGVVDGSFGYFFGLHTLAPGITGLQTANTSITHWQGVPYDEDWGQRNERSSSLRWRLMRYNDDLHVRDLDAQARLGWVPFSREEQPVQVEMLEADE
jgi:probable phosphoglycerate mutase